MEKEYKSPCCGRSLQCSGTNGATGMPRKPVAERTGGASTGVTQGFGQLVFKGLTPEARHGPGRPSAEFLGAIRWGTIRPARQWVGHQARGATLTAKVTAKRPAA